MTRALLAALLAAAPAAAQDANPADPPLMTPSRSGEDYSYLADPARRSGAWWEPLKYIPLGGDAYLSTGLEARARVELFENNLWGDAEAPDDAYLWTRLLPYADLHVGPVRAFAQLGVTESVGVAPRASFIDEGGVDLLQSFVEARVGGDTNLTLRGGRFLLALGYERLVTTRWGPNTPLAFDGGLATLAVGENWRAQALYVRPVDAGTRDFDDATSRARMLWGLYTTRRGLAVAGGTTDLDAYYLGYRNRRARFDDGMGREVRHTLGVRAAGKARDWDWDWEGFYQFGEFAGNPIEAWSLGTITGRTFARGPLRPRVTLGAAVISGDAKRDDDRLGTFNALLPRGKYFGELSPLGPNNLVLGQPAVTLALAPEISLGLAAAAFWRHRTADGIYSVPGQLVRPAGDSRARYIGTEAEASLDWTPLRWLSLSASVAMFRAGPFLRETGGNETIGFAAFQTMVRW